MTQLYKVISPIKACDKNYVANPPLNLISCVILLGSNVFQFVDSYPASLVVKVAEFEYQRWIILSFSFLVVNFHRFLKGMPVLQRDKSHNICLRNHSKTLIIFFVVRKKIRM